MTGEEPIVEFALFRSPPLTPEEWSAQERAVQEALTGVGPLRVTVRKERVAVGGPDLQFLWNLIIVAPAAAFFAGMAKKAGEDAYLALKRVVVQLWQEHREEAPEGVRIQFHDKASHAFVTLEPDLPDKAYAALSTLDWSKVAAGELRYDHALDQWRARGD